MAMEELLLLGTIIEAALIMIFMPSVLMQAEWFNGQQMELLYAQRQMVKPNPRLHQMAAKELLLLGKMEEAQLVKMIFMPSELMQAARFNGQQMELLCAHRHVIKTGLGLHQMAVKELLLLGWITEL